MGVQHKLLGSLVFVQHKLLGSLVFLLLSLSFCHGKNVKVLVIGHLHCTDCIRHEITSSQASSGINVFIRCKSREKTIQGSGEVDRAGKFIVTLSAETAEHGNSVDRCFAKLQSESAASPCPLHTAQTASVQLISTEKNATQAALNEQTLIKFSPGTCQSAMFWPFPSTFFGNPPPSPEQPIDYIPPPSQALPSDVPPAQPPLPPVETLIPPPASTFPPTLPPPAPKFGTPSPQPHVNFRTPLPAPEPAFHIPQSPPYPPHKSPSQPPVPKHNTPSLPPTLPPVNEPISPESSTPIPSPFSSHPLPNLPPQHSKLPPPALSPLNNKPFPPPKPRHFHKLPLPTTPPVGAPSQPHHTKPNPIPKAPPVPRLPDTPKVPRKYFNPPESKAHPPKPSYPSHS